WKTVDYGTTWIRIDRGIRPSDFTRVIREDPERQGLLYAGTERGVWVSFNDGADWQSLQNNLPPVPVHDLSIAGDDLVAGTHGRSFWVLENLAVLRQLSPEVIAKSFHLFQPAPAYRSLNGVQVAYWLKQSGQKVTVEFLDGGGNVIKSYSSTPPASPAAAAPADDSRKLRADSLRNLGVMEAASLAGMATGGRGGRPGGPGGRSGGAPQESRAPSGQGMNRFSWNLRHADATRFDGMIMWAAGTTGPVAAPGEHMVRLTVGEAVQTQTFRVLVDPRSGASEADVVEQVAFLLKVRDKTTEANDWVRTVRSVRSQLQARIKEAGSRGGPLERMARPFLAELASAEAEIYQVKNESGQDPLNFPIRLNNKIAALAGVVGSSEGRPTKQSYEVYEILADSLAIQTRKLQGAIDGTLPRINAELSRLGLQTIEAKPEDAGAAGEEEPGVAERQKW
ncbi:MAG: glycosyl hydrolase, partial [Gemmatimonadota bacterium]